jgi:hypothetical protein
VTRANDSLLEPVLVASWWRHRGSNAIRVRLLAHKGRACVGVRAWRTGRDGALRPGEGFTVDVRHIRQFPSAFAAARKAGELGLLSKVRA